MAGRFSLYAGGVARQRGRCGSALGYSLVHGNSPGRSDLAAFSVVVFDDRVDGFPFCLFLLEIESFRKMALRRRLFCDGMVLANVAVAFSAGVPYARRRGECRGRLRVNASAAGEWRSLFPGGSGGAPAFGVLAGAVLYFVAVDFVPLCGCCSAGQLDAA